MAFLVWQVVRLLAQLGKQRMQESVPKMTKEELRGYASELGVKLAEAEERKEKAELLGKIEAELWRRKQEAPVATGSLDIPELKALLKKLQGGAPASAPEEAASK